MDFDELRRLLEMVREHELTEFELEREGFKIRIKKPPTSGVPSPPADLGTPVASAPTPGQHTAPATVVGSSSAAADPSADTVIELAVVKSPIVGTFFRATEPGAPPFVQVGDVVKKGQVLAIIEAMKLMNQIDSEYDGEVVTVYAEDGQPVQYGERLFAIRTA